MFCCEKMERYKVGGGKFGDLFGGLVLWFKLVFVFDIFGMRFL